MAAKRWFLLCGAAFVALVQTGWSQRVSGWRVYRAADGLPESACITVSVTPQGKVLAATPGVRAVAELDGYTVSNLPAPAGPIGGRVCESPGGQVWSVAPEGLQELSHGMWRIHPVPEIALEMRGHLGEPGRRIPIYPVRQGLVLFLLPDRLMQYSAENPAQPRTTVLRTAAQTQIGRFEGMTAARGGGLWIAGARGLARVPGPVRALRADTAWSEYPWPEGIRLRDAQEPLADEAGGVSLVGDTNEGLQKAVVHFDGRQWTVRPVGTANVRLAWRGPGGSCWAATTDAILQWESSQPQTSENEDISAAHYYDVSVEAGGAFWLATSDGLFRYAPPIWRKPAEVPANTTQVDGLAEDADGRLWFVSGEILHCVANGVYREFPLPKDPPGLRIVRALFPMGNGRLLLDLGDQALEFDPATSSFGEVPLTLGNHRVRPLGLLKDGSVCFQDSSGGGFLALFDGSAFRSSPYSLPESDSGVPGTFTAMYAARNGDLWLSGEQALLWYHERKWFDLTSKDNTTPEAAVKFAETGDGKTWCATRHAIWEFDGRDWSLLRAGFDRINDLLASRDGTIWIACNSGLFHFYQGSWIENGPEEGLPSASVREVSEDQHGRIWVATAHGLSVYHPEADPDPPRTIIRWPMDQKATVPEGSVAELSFTGLDRWKYTPRLRLLYSYRLDEREWSPFQEMNTVFFGDLSAGRHYFQVRAMDRNGNVDPTPAMLAFTVTLPWYRETRLVLIALLGLGAAVFFAALAFNRHRQLLRSYAAVEKKVADRTRELEIASRELYQSQKMNALGTLAAGIAHDFNNILSIIKGSAQIIEGNLDDPQRIRTRLDRIKTVVEQGSGIVKAMLGFSRDSGGPVGQCHPNEVVDDTIKLLGDRFLREVEVRFEPGTDLPVIAVSKDFIQQILLNFIFNAAESMPKRKQVIVSTRQLDRLPEGMALAPGAAARYVSFSVRDFGCGIPPENLPRIFEPFFTTKSLSARRGTGLGLSMVYELAKKIEGGLAVESILDQGSTFTLLLPVRELPPEPGSRKAEEKTPGKRPPQPRPEELSPR